LDVGEKVIIPVEALKKLSERLRRCIDLVTDCSLEKLRNQAHRS